MEQNELPAQAQEGLFEVRMPVGDSDKVVIIERTPDEAMARIAFDAARKAMTYLTPRPKASLELYFGSIALDVFEQTEEVATA